MTRTWVYLVLKLAGLRVRLPSLPSLPPLPIIIAHHCEVKVNCMGAVRGQIIERDSLCTQDLAFNEIGLKCSYFCHQRCDWKKNSFKNLNLLINSHGWYEESLTLLSFTGIRLNTANPSLSTGKDFLMHSLGKDWWLIEWPYSKNSGAIVFLLHQNENVIL